MTVTACILMFGKLTGGSVNPARTIGPAVAAGIYDGIAVYLIAQLVSGTAAGIMYRVFWMPGDPFPRRCLAPFTRLLNEHLGDVMANVLDDNNRVSRWLVSAG